MFSSLISTVTSSGPHPEKSSDMKASQEVEVRLGHAYDADKRDVDMAAKVLATAHDEQEITHEEMDAVR